MSVASVCKAFMNFAEDPRPTAQTLTNIDTTSVLLKEEPPAAYVSTSTAKRLNAGRQSVKITMKRAAKVRSASLMALTTATGALAVVVVFVKD